MTSGKNDANARADQSRTGAWGFSMVVEELISAWCALRGKRCVAAGAYETYSPLTISIHVFVYAKYGQADEAEYQRYPQQAEEGGAGAFEQARQPTPFSPAGVFFLNFLVPVAVLGPLDVCLGGGFER